MAAGSWSWRQTARSCTKDWEPISNHILQLVHRILEEQAPAIRAAFGDWRHAHSRTLVKRTLEARSSSSKGAWIRFVDALSARVQALLGSGRSAVAEQVHRER